MSAEAIEEVKTCPECSSDRIIRDYERAEIVCGQCGLVLDDHIIDEGPEWTAYNSREHEQRSRAGAPCSYVGQAPLTTGITLLERDGKGHAISPKQAARFYRLGKLQKWATRNRPEERSHSKILRAVKHIAENLGLPESIVDEATQISKNAARRRWLKGRSVDQLAAAAIYAVCRRRHAPRSLEELSHVTGMPKKVIGKAYTSLSRTLGLRVPQSQPADYVSRFCSELGLGIAVEIEARRLLRERYLVNGNGSNPLGLVGAAIYEAAKVSGQDRTQERVANVAGVSEPTIRNRAKAEEGRQ